LTASYLETAVYGPLARHSNTANFYHFLPRVPQEITQVTPRCIISGMDVVQPEFRCLEISADAKTICEIPTGKERISWGWVKTGNLQNIIDQLEEDQVEEARWAVIKEPISTGHRLWLRKKPPTMGGV
jgi:hypothetical protein